MGATVGASGGEERAGRAGARRRADPRRRDRRRRRPPPAPTPDPVDALTLQQQVGRLVVLRFNGTTVPSYVRNVLHNGWASGRDPVQGERHLAASSWPRSPPRCASPGKAGGAMPIICTDQEGGVIRNVDVGAAQPARSPGRSPGATPRPAAVALRKAGHQRQPRAGRRRAVRRRARRWRGREFSRDPAAGDGDAGRDRRLAARAASQPTVKHFPGLGGATVNTDQGSATIRGGAPTAADLAPFKAAIAAQVPIVMSSHAVYPRLDARHIASQSPAILEDAAARAAAVQRRGHDRQRRGGGRARHRADRGRSPCARSARATTSCSRPARDRGSGPTGHCSPEARSSKSFRALVRASAARVLALQAHARARTFVLCLRGV